MMYDNFDEILNAMVTPEMNSEKLLKLMLSSNASVEGKLMLTQNFHYDLNPWKEEPLSFFVENVRFKAKIFLNSINKLTPEEYKLHEKDFTNKSFIDFMTFLSTISEDDFLKYVDAKRNKSLEPNKKKTYIGYYEKIIGDKHGDDFSPLSKSWYYFRSYTLQPNMKESFHSKDIKHRLYISINFDQLMNFTTDFISMLSENNIPYLLKIKSCLSDGKCRENDTLVIYADSEKRVVEYVNIIKKLIDGNTKYRESIHVPSAHLGVIANCIGYGREFEKGTSYSGVVGEIGLNAINYAFQDVTDKVGVSRKYSKEEMLQIMERMKHSLSFSDEYNCFKDRFWNKFYELMKQRGYPVESSICTRNRENPIY